MITEKQTENLVIAEEALEDSIVMSLDLDSAQFLMQMLSKNLYSDPIGSTIRETVSNAIDSHRRAKVDEPVIVTLDKDDAGNMVFSVEDFGIGLDDNDIVEILSKYGKSTKRESADEFGMFGIGFKSPLSYSSSFFFIARKDGIERKYMMYEGESSNMIDRLYQKATEERNGTKVIVPVNTDDQYLFLSKITEQLAYFENVYFNVNTYRFSWSAKYSEISNDFKIYRNELFQTSQLCTFSEMHICLDDVYYPLDFQKLGIDIIKFPVGLRFTLTDGIFPTPNREDIRYTQEAKTIIKNRIIKVADYVVTKMNEYRSSNELENAQEIIKFLQKYANSNEEIYSFQNVEYDVNNLVKHSNIPLQPVKVKGTTYMVLKDFAKEFESSMFNEYQLTNSMIGGKLKGSKSYIDLYKLRDRNICIANQPINGLKREYVKSHFSSGLIVVSKVLKFKLFGRYHRNDSYSYYNLLKLNTIPRDKWRAMISDFQQLLKLILESGTNIDELEVPKVWKENVRKNNRYRQRGSTDVWENLGVTYKIGVELQKRLTNRFCRFESATSTPEEFFSYKGLTIYSKHDENTMLERLYSTTIIRKARLITVSDREFKKIQNADPYNFITIDEFMKGNTRPFKRIITAQLIDELIDDNYYVFRNIETMRQLSKPFGDKLNTLVKYRDKYRPYGPSRELIREMKKVAEEFNLYDTNILYLHDEIKATLEKHPYLLNITKVVSSSYQYDILVDLCKYHKFRLDYTNYKLKNKES